MLSKSSLYTCHVPLQWFWDLGVNGRCTGYDGFKVYGSPREINGLEID